MSSISVRVSGSKALGGLAAIWPIEHEDEVFSLLWEHLSSDSAHTRQVVSLVLDEWSSYTQTSLIGTTAAAAATRAARLLPERFQVRLLEVIEQAASLSAANYPEVDRLYQQLISDYRILLASMQALAPAIAEGVGITNELAKIPSPSLAGSVLATAEFPLLPATTLVTSANQLYTAWCSGVKSNQVPLEAELAKQLEARQVRVIFSAACTQSTQRALQTSVSAVAAAALVAWSALPSKLNSVIRALMDSVKQEENLVLQSRSAAAVARLTRLCLSRKGSPSIKIVSNLAAFVAHDRRAVPIVDLHCTESIATVGDSVTGDMIVDDTAKEPSVSASTANGTGDDTAAFTRRGAELCFRELARTGGAQLFDDLPKLWECAASKIIEYTQAHSTLGIAVINLAESKNGSGGSASDSKCNASLLAAQSHEQQAPNRELAQALVDSLQVFACILPYLHAGLHARVCQLLVPVISLVRSVLGSVRLMAARCLAAFCTAIPLVSMQTIIKYLIPILGDASYVPGRKGAALAIHNIIRQLGMTILPYLVFLVVPILGRMSDQVMEVRKLVTNSFATLVRLMPLEAGAANPDGLSDELVVQKERERRFLEQLLDGSKLDNYELPIPVQATLRKYQQEGVNWLAFLAKYKLHGILCDDMGLGKTLQTLCIVASNTHVRKCKYEESNYSVDCLPLPSLIVCPTTVVGHWLHEARKFFPDHLAPVAYSGPPGERERLRPQLASYNLIIVSYEILRNDIEFLRTIPLNYCVLDEGHIIKNGNTKITKAVKTIQADHRLLLSGTPIQNNVLELWSLFDFLMPGFLGTESQFNNQFGKPILASKDPKCTPKV
jgi:TATA-binding protein-associated factor